MPHISSKLLLSLGERTTAARRLLEKLSWFRHKDPTEDGLAFWRERILFSVLAAGTGLSLIALIPAVYMAFSEGLWLLAILDVCAALASGCLLIVPIFQSV